MCYAGGREVNTEHRAKAINWYNLYNIYNITTYTTYTTINILINILIDIMTYITYMVRERQGGGGGDIHREVSLISG